MRKRRVLFEMVFRIRLATKEDLPICTGIIVDEFNRQGEHWTAETAGARLAELFENGPEVCFCFELDEKVIGQMYCEKYKFEKGDYFWVSEFAISLEHQGKGYGLKALQFIEQFAKERGFNVLVLATHVERKAFKMYQKFGFKNTNYVLMEKEL